MPPKYEEAPAEVCRDQGQGEETSKRCNDTIIPSESREQDDSRFDWANDPAIVIKRQPAIAIYVNCRDELVIRQEADVGFDSDECIFVRPDHAETLARAIVNVAKPKRLRIVDGGA